MVAKPLCPLYKNVIKPLDRARYPELRYKLHEKYVLPKSFLRKYVVLPKFIFVIYVVLPKSFLRKYVVLPKSFL